MSYILDALRKAEAEREQGRVPGLHSQLGTAPAPSPPEPPTTAPPSRSSWPRMLGAGLAGAMLAALAWWWALQRSDTPPPPPSTHVEQEGLDSAKDSATHAPPTPVPTRPVVQPVPSPDLPLPQPAPPTRHSPSQVPAKASPPPSPPPAQNTVSVRPLSELPDAVRRSLPPLVFGGAMHSDNATSRMLVINNNVYREGDEPSPGLLLEEIRLKSAVFRFQGQRFSVNY